MIDEFLLKLVKRNAKKVDKKLERKHRREVNKDAKKLIRKIRRELSGSKTGAEAVKLVTFSTKETVWEGRGFPDYRKTVAHSVAAYYNEMGFEAKVDEGCFSPIVSVKKPLSEHG